MFIDLYEWLTIILILGRNISYNMMLVYVTKRCNMCEAINTKQVFASKGLDISCPTTMVMPFHIGFT